MKQVFMCNSIKFVMILGVKIKSSIFVYCKMKRVIIINHIIIMYIYNNNVAEILISLVVNDLIV